MNINPLSHKKKCKFRIAATCAVAIECPHGYDACPQCDPCTCTAENKLEVLLR